MGAQERRQRAIERDVEVMVETGELDGKITRSGGNFMVKSFKQIDVTYQVKVSENVIQECSCPYFVQQHAICKHIYAILRTTDRALSVVYATDIADRPMPDHLGVQEEETPPEEFTRQIDEVQMNQLNVLSELEAHHKGNTATYYRFKDQVSRTTSLEEVAEVHTQARSWIAGQSAVMTTVINGSNRKKRKTQPNHMN